MFSLLFGGSIILTIVFIIFCILITIAPFIMIAQLKGIKKEIYQLRKDIYNIKKFEYEQKNKDAHQ